MLRLALSDHAEHVVARAHRFNHRIAQQGVIETVGQGSLAFFQQGVAFLCRLKHFLQRLGAVGIVVLLTQCVTCLIDGCRIGINR